jgi:uncharacterized protein (DUF486 family)
MHELKMRTLICKLVIFTILCIFYVRSVCQKNHLLELTSHAKKMIVSVAKMQNMLTDEANH